MVEYYEARVLFDYIPTTSDELCLRAGEYIEVRVDPNDLDGGEQGWLSGSDLRGCHGVFPANYVLDLRTVGADVSDAPAPEHDTDATVDSTFIRGRPEAMEREDMAIQGGQLGADRDVATGDRGAPSLRNNLPANNRDAVTLSNSDSAAGLEGTATTPPTALVGGAYDTRTERGTAAVASSGEDTVSAAQVDDGSTHKPVAANGEPQGPSPNDDNVDRLPDGWFSAVDEASGVVYYYTEGGPSSWTRPVAVQTPPHTHEATIGETVNAANENCATNSGLITASNSSYSEVSIASNSSAVCTVCADVGPFAACLARLASAMLNTFLFMIARPTYALNSIVCGRRNVAGGRDRMSFSKLIPDMCCMCRVCCCALTLRVFGMWQLPGGKF